LPGQKKGSETKIAPNSSLISFNIQISRSQVPFATQNRGKVFGQSQTLGKMDLAGPSPLPLIQLALINLILSLKKVKE